MERPWKKRPGVKGKANHKKQNCTSCQSLSVTPPDTVSTECNIKIWSLFSKKLARESKCKQKHCITCRFTLMQTTRKMIFHVCACIVRLQVLICYVNTRLQRFFNRFSKKSGIECCFWSAQCIGTKARTSDFVKFWVF